METFTIRSLSFSYPEQERKAIDDLTLSVGQGEFVVLCGPSGCGKSTLLRQLKTVLAPCFAALGAMNSEIKSRKWLWGGIGLQFAAGYTVAYLVYQIGTLMIEGHFGAGFVPGLIVVAAIVAGILYLINRTNRGLAAEYAWNT